MVKIIVIWYIRTNKTSKIMLNCKKIKKHKQTNAMKMIPRTRFKILITCLKTENYKDF
jgi:hypothetical protein